MSIGSRRRKDGRVVYDVRLRDANNRQYSRTFATRKEAVTFEAQELADRSRGTWMDSRLSQISFEEMARRWLGHNPAKRESGLARDESVLRIHISPVLGGRQIGSITPADIQALVKAWTESLAPRTVRRQYGVLTAVLNFSVESDVIARSPARGVKLPARPRRLRPVLDAGSVQALAIELERLGNCGLMAFLGAGLGLRWGECAGLRVRDLDLLARTVVISSQRTRGLGGRMVEQPPKSEAGRRSLSLPAVMVPRIAEHLARRGITAATPDEPLFVGPRGRPLHYSAFRQRVWLPARATIGQPDLEFHDLRRTNATWMVREGVDVKTAQVRLGHSDPRLTIDLYAQATSAADRAAAAALDRCLEEPTSPAPDSDERGRTAADVR